MRVLRSPEDGREVAPIDSRDRRPAERRDPRLMLAATIGNAAFSGMVARRTGGRAPKPAPAARPAPWPGEAIDYVNTYYQRARDLLMLKTMVEQQAIDDAKRFGDLKDPPSISAAVFAEIFSQVIGLIPGGRFVTAAVEGALFASELSKLKRELANPAADDVIDFSRPTSKDLAEARAKGPSDATKKTAEKTVEVGKTAAGSGKAVIDAARKAAEEQAAATAAEVAAIEHAAMQSSRITDWSEAIQRLQAQEDAIKLALRAAARLGVDHDQIKAIVAALLGPYPSMKGQQEKLSRQYELKLYWKKLRLIRRTSNLYRGSELESSSTEDVLEFFGGGKPSQALLRRIADRLDNPMLALSPTALGTALGLQISTEEVNDKRPAYTGNRQ